MKLAFQLAYKNLMGGGLKTWLNVGILAFTYLLIVFYNGFMDGWNRQSVNDSIAWETGYGQLWHEDYDPDDPFTISNGHGDYSNLDMNHLTPVLLRQGTLYPDGRMIPVLIKGISKQQDLLKLPTSSLSDQDDDFAIIIGERFATSNMIEIGDRVLLRWRDANGTFDARDVTVADIFKTDVSTVDVGQIWMSIDQLQEMTGLKSEATYLVASKAFEAGDLESWTFHDHEELLAGLFAVIKSKKASGSILYLLLLAIALLAIFDTQVLSIWRRQREIGTYVSLGMTRWQVVKLFTVEGAMYSIFAAAVAFVIGFPLLGWSTMTGIPIPEASQSTGVNIGGVIFPYYGLGLILTTLLLVLITATIVSFLPARKIARMDPVNALKGKLQ